MEKRGSDFIAKIRYLYGHSSHGLGILLGMIVGLVRKVKAWKRLANVLGRGVRRGLVQWYTRKLPGERVPNYPITQSPRLSNPEGGYPPPGYPIPQ